MKKLIIILCLIVNTNVFSQFDLSGGMGIGAVHNSSLRDYINQSFPGEKELATFNTSFELFIETDYSLSKNMQLGIEYVFSIYSYNTATFGGIGVYDVTYNHHKPSLLAYYVIPGEGYKFKFGGGLGMRFIDLDEKIFDAVNYTANGFGLLLRAQGLTTLGGNVYANIGGTFRYDIPGEVQNSRGNSPGNSIEGQNVNINSIIFSIDVGISYSF